MYAEIDMRSIINIFGFIGLLLLVVGIIMARNNTTIVGVGIGFGRYAGQVNEIGGLSVMFFGILVIGACYYYNLKR